MNGRYLSLAELVHVLTGELAELHRTGKLPQTVKAVKVYGPIRLVTGHGPTPASLRWGNSRASARNWLVACMTTDPLGAEQRHPPPRRRFNGIDLNPAQVLRLMAQAVVNPAPPGSNPRLVLLVPSIFRG